MTNERAERAKKLIEEINNMKVVNEESYTNSSIISQDLYRRPNIEKRIDITFGGVYYYDDTLRIPERYKEHIVKAIREVLSMVEEELHNLDCQ